MKSSLTFSLLFSLFFFGACSGGKYAATELPELQLNFGNGGGFTGAEQMFVLLKNGQVFKKNSLTQEAVELPKLKRKLIKNVFKEAESLKLDSLNINSPGNMYKFIEFKLPGIESKRLTWGSTDKPVHESIEAFYNSLTELVNQKSDQE